MCVCVCVYTGGRIEITSELSIINVGLTKFLEATEFLF